MSELNLLKSYKEWFRENPDFGSPNQQDVPDDDINLGLVKLDIKDVAWISSIPHDIQQRSLTRQVNISKAGASSTGDGAFGQVHASKDSETGISVTMKGGVIKGLNRYCKLSLDKLQQELKDNFGDFLEFDPSKYQSHIKQNNLKLEVAMEQKLSSGGATAVINYKGKEYKATFTCTAVIHGKAPMRVRGSFFEQEISQILSDLQRKYNGRSPDLAALTIKRTNVELQMTGEVEFRWESDHSIAWQDK